MKIQRYKRVRRLLNFYKYRFGFEPPFKIVLDGTFCKAALDNKLNLREQMPIYLGGVECQFLTTSCMLKELQALGPNLKGALSVAQSYTCIKCKHPTSLAASKCIGKLAGSGNSSKYFFATQDPLLTEKLRQVPGCPIFFIKYNSVLLERPSEMTCQKEKEQTDEKVNFEGVQREHLTELLAKNNLLPEKKVQMKRKRKKKEPNPLSCLKKKKLVKGNNASVSKTRRRRKTKPDAPISVTLPV